MNPPFAIIQIAPDEQGQSSSRPMLYLRRGQGKARQSCYPLPPPPPPRHLRISDKSIGEGILTICVGNYTIHSLGKRLGSPEIDSKELIPSAYVAWRAGSSKRVVVPAHQAVNRSPASLEGLKIRALDKYTFCRAGFLLYNRIKTY